MAVVDACGASCSAACGILVPRACMLSHSVASDSLQPPWTVACWAPLSMGFPRQEYWRGLPFPSPGDLPDSMSSSLQGRFLITGPPRKSHENEKLLNRCQAVHLPDSSRFKKQRALHQRPPGWPSFLSIVDREILWKPSSVQGSPALVSCKTSTPGLANALPWGQEVYSWANNTKTLHGFQPLSWTEFFPLLSSNLIIAWITQTDTRLFLSIFLIHIQNDAWFIIYVTLSTYIEISYIFVFSLTSEVIIFGDFPGVQWLRFRLLIQRVWVQSLVGELRSHMPHGQKTET